MNSKKLRKFTKSLTKAREILNYKNDLNSIFGRRRAKLLDEVLDLIEDDIVNSLDGEEISPTEDEVEKVSEIVSSFVHIAYENPIESIFKDLSMSYLLIVYNWNEMGLRDNKIAHKINSVIEILQEKNSLNTSISVLKSLNRRSSKILNEDSGSVRLSRAYMRNLKENS